MNRDDLPPSGPGCTGNATRPDLSGVVAMASRERSRQAGHGVRPLDPAPARDRRNGAAARLDVMRMGLCSCTKA